MLISDGQKEDSASRVCWYISMKKRKKTLKKKTRSLENSIGYINKDPFFTISLQQLYENET